MLSNEYLSGQSVKGYDLYERIGAGAFGAVYRAYQSTVGREVAVKVILPGFANHPDFIRRFEMEAQLVARLEHIHVVPLYDYWRDPDGAYLVMRWLRGGSLKHALQEAPYDLTSAVKVLDQISSGLAAAHRKDIVHRDIKPTNILLDEEGNAYLADFGIARDLGRPAGSTDKGETIVGSPTYLSPEQVRRELVSPQSDIYNLGVVLYELLVGQHPFRAATPIEIMYRHLNDPLPPIEGLEPDLQEGINAVIQKATAKNPRQRYKDVLEMAAAFRQAANVAQNRSDSSLVEALTGREQEILALIVAGHSNKQIAQDLYVELTTVKWYITQIYRKLNARGRMQAIVRARELQLFVPGKEEGDSSDQQKGSSSLAFELTNPYKGLRAFEAADSRDFFGREALTARLVSRLGEEANRSRFLAIVGPSGCGKSSLVKAGLIPTLRRGELPGSERWFVVEMSPGEGPLDELEVALARVAANQGENLRLHLERDANGLLRAANLILPQDGSQLLIVIDQFEAIFSRVGEEERRHFLDLITAAATGSNSRVRIIITLRADYYDRPLQYPEFGELVRRCMETVLPLNAEELERAILRPADQAGAKFEPGLAATIIDDIHYQPGALPLLQYALAELFDNRQDGLLTQQAYRQIGGTAGALAKRAEQIYAQQSQEGKEATRQLFLRLVSLGDGGMTGGAAPETQRRAVRADLLAIAADAELMDAVIDTYAAYRLLSLDHDPATRQPTVQLAHEAILREWERLRSWIDESREDLLQQQRLSLLAQEWRTAGRDEGYLLREARLEQLSAWAATTRLKLAPDEAAFLQASQAARQARQAEEEARRQRELETARKLAETERQRAEEQSRAASGLRRLASYLAVALVAALGLAAAAYLFSRQAEAQRRLAFTRELAAASISSLDKDPELGLLLALRAVEGTYLRDGTILREAEEALHRSLLAQRLLLNIPHGGALALSPDGAQIATGGEDGMIKIWDADTGDPLRSFAAHTASISDLAFSPDGSRILSGSLDGTLELWDVRSGEQVLSTSSSDGPVYSVAYSPDGKRLAAGMNNLVLIRDALTGDEISRFIETYQCGEVRDMAYTLDGKWLGITYSDGCNQVLDAQTGDCCRMNDRDPLSTDVSGVAFSPAGSRVAVSSTGGDAKVRNVINTAGTVYLRGHTGNVKDLDFSPDGRYVATSSEDGTARFWDSNTGEQLTALAGHRLSVNLVAFFPDGQRLATTSDDGTTRVWDVSLSGSREWLTVGDQTGKANYVTFSPDGRYFVTSEDTLVGIYDATSGLRVLTLENVAYKGKMVEFTPNSGQLVAIYNYLLPGLFDAETGELLMKYVGHFGGVSALAISPDGWLLASGGTDGMIKVWDVASGEEIGTLEIHAGEIYDLEFSPDGSQLASSSQDGRVILWDVGTRQPAFNLVKNQPAVVSLSFSPDGKRLVTSGKDGSARVWDTVSGEMLLTLKGHRGEITGVDYSPDSKRIATASIDSTARLWDAASGEELLILGGSISGLTSLAFYPDGKRLATSSLDGTVRIYALDMEDLLMLARQRVTRSLTLDECQRYLHTQTCPPQS
jgi:WD40 repeat protein/serine/threonine protein kinase